MNPFGSFIQPLGGLRCISPHFNASLSNKTDFGFFVKEMYLRGHEDKFYLISDSADFIF